MASQSIYDIREDKINIDGKDWHDEEVQQLAFKSLYITQRMIDFWTPLIQRGEELFRIHDGKILDDMQRATYEEIEDKVVIEPPITKSPIRALLGQVIKARKSGTITTEEGDLDTPFDNPNEIASVNITLKDLEKKTKEQVKIRDAIHDALITCFPNVLMWQKRRPTGDNPLKYSLVKLPWNSCVFGPINIREPDFSDINELIYYDLRSMADLIEDFPDSEENLTDHWSNNKVDDKLICSIMHWDNTQDARDINYLKAIIDAAQTNIRGPGGLVPTFQRLFKIKTKQEVWVNTAPSSDDEENSDHVIIPSTWGEKRKQEWIDTHKQQYEGPVEREIVTLWRTVFTSTGLVLNNEKHWYQDCGKIPATIFVPCMLNGTPSGPMLDMKPEALRNCIAQIEYLDDMRKGGGQILITKEGYLTKQSAENITEEANKSLGVVILSKDSPADIGTAYRIEKREPSKAWREYGEFAKSDMIENTRLNEAMQGESNPRQAAIAKENEIAQALVVSALYIDNFNLQWENHQNLKLSLLPYIYDESMMIVEGYDEEQKSSMQAMLNIPQYDNAGEKTSVINDITSKKYRWKVSPVDDSPSAKSRMMQDALIIINGAFGPLKQADPSGSFLAKFLLAMDNPILNKAGKLLADDAKVQQEQMSKTEQEKVKQEAAVKMMKAQAEMEKAKKAGVSFAVTGEQLAQYPNLMQFYLQLLETMGVVTPQQQMPQAAPQPAPQQAAPEQAPVNPQPEMAPVA